MSASRGKFVIFGSVACLPLGEARLKISYPRIPFRLELLNGLVKVSSGSSDLLINENCTLLQITPDVAHRTLTRLLRPEQM